MAQALPSSGCSDEGREWPAAVGRGLLTGRGSWSLPIGASQARPLRRVAALLLVLSAGLLTMWLFALVSEAGSGQGRGGVSLALAGISALCWSNAAWRMHTSLHRDGTVVLQWGGLPPFKPGPADHRDLPGWSMGEAGQAVTVHVVFDVGAWILIRMKPVSVEHEEVWSWLHAKSMFKGVTGHRLRALLFSPRANAIGLPKPQPQGAQPKVASSGHPSSSRSETLRSSTKKPRRPARPSSRSSQGRRLGQVLPESVFADTLADPIDRSNA